jgi:hypothetical protein
MATTAVSPSSSPLSPAKINVRLCGSVPRQEMECLSMCKRPPFVLQSEIKPFTMKMKPTVHTIEDKDCVASQLCHQLTSMRQQQESQSSSSAPTFEAPSWAVPAQGESRLEPICDSVDRQMPVDLTDRSVFRIGRSPQSDVQLLHATSSRRHAMLFHHSNGSCYIIDCESAHGTYVNGVRISSPPSGGVVVPHRVRRGSIVRFGGPGAPSFMLKSFAFKLEEMKDYQVSYTPTLSPASSINFTVKHNTRLNALGKTAKDSLAMSLSSKRSFDSMDTVECDDYECKRMRCLSPPLSPEQEPVRLVSPDMGLPSKRRVTFSEEPPSAFLPSLVSPDLSCDENDDDA